MSGGVRMGLFVGEIGGLVAGVEGCLVLEGLV